MVTPLSVPIARDDPGRVKYRLARNARHVPTYLPTHVRPRRVYCVTVTWCKDNVPIGEDSAVYQFMQAGNKYRMKILRAGHDDIGQYVVEAKDAANNGVQVTAAFSVNLSFLSE